MYIVHLIKFSNSNYTLTMNMVLTNGWASRDATVASPLIIALKRENPRRDMRNSE